jgi:hypothetical protein
VKTHYERKIAAAKFPGEYKNEAERDALMRRCEHKSKNAVEEMRVLHERIYAPQKPEEPNIKDFKAPEETSDEKDKSSKYGCLSFAGLVIAGFFALGFLVTLFDKDNIATLPVILTLSGMGGALFGFSKYQTNKIKAAQNKRTEEALSEYNQKKNSAIAEYNAKIKIYEEKTESYKSRLKVFLEEYATWRTVYLEQVAEETIIAEKLEQDRLAGIEKIHREELTPILNELASFSDIISTDYLPAIDTIIDLLKSGRADDLKEALNLYEEMLYRERQLQLQREQEWQRQQEEELRRQDEERRYREEMRFRESQERNRQREEVQRQQDAERRHREEMDQRAQLERNRQYEERKRIDEERRRADKAELARRQDEDRAMRRQCNTCTLASNCSMAFRRPNCASYKPR